MATFKQLEKVERGDNTIYTGSGGVAYLKYKHDPNDPNNLNVITPYHPSTVYNSKKVCRKSCRC